MSLRNEIQNLTEKLQRLDQHATIERYKDRTVDQELDHAHRQIYCLQEAVTKLELEKGFLTAKKQNLSFELAQYDNRLLLPFKLKPSDITWTDKDGFSDELIGLAVSAIVVAINKGDTIK